MERLVRKEDIEAAAKRTPMGRLGTVRDVADATVWLCSEAGSFINGTNVIGKSALTSVVSVHPECNGWSASWFETDLWQAEDSSLELESVGIPAVN